MVHYALWLTTPLSRARLYFPSVLLLLWVGCNNICFLYSALLLSTVLNIAFTSASLPVRLGCSILLGICPSSILPIKVKSESVSHSVIFDSLWPMSCSPPGSSVHGISQARILEWVAIPFSRGSSQPRAQTWVSCIAGRFFTVCATREAISSQWAFINFPSRLAQDRLRWYWPLELQELEP